jgi:hypothetical protein
MAFRSQWGADLRHLLHQLMLSFSVPPGYRRRERPASKKLGPYLAWIDAIVEGDSQVHKKQRHTAHRIFERLRDEQGFTGGYSVGA